MNVVRILGLACHRGAEHRFGFVNMSTARLVRGTSLASLILPARKAQLAAAVGALGAVIGAVVAPDAIIAATVLAFALAWAAAVDFDRLILPDTLTLGLIVAGLCSALADGIDATGPHVLGAIVGYAALAGFAWLYRLVRKRNGLGLGDAKLFGAAGAWLGWQALPFVILIASMTCLALVGATALVRKQPITHAHMAFGPYLAMAIWIIWLIQMSGRS